MADVALTAKLYNFEEASTKLHNLAKKLNETAYSDEQWADVIKKLNVIKDENLAKIKAREAATQRLKDHTVELVRQFQIQEAAERAADSMMARMGETLRGVALRYLGLTAVIGGVVATLSSARHAALEAAAADARLETTLQATGNVVGFTKKQLDEFSASMAKSTHFTDEQVKAAAAVMLTFKNVIGETFTVAMKAAADYAAFTGRDLTTAARTVGRAFNDPVHGLNLLELQFGRLDPVQKKHIEQLIETGRLAEAQAIIQAKLNGAIGGFAESLRGAAGSAATVTEKWADFLKEIGRSPVIMKPVEMALSGWALILKTVTEEINDLVSGKTKIKLLQLGLEGATLENKERIRAEITKLQKDITVGEAEEIENRRNAAAVGEEERLAAAKRAQQALLAERARAHAAERRREEQENEEARDIERKQIELQIKNGEAVLEHLQGVLKDQLTMTTLNAKERQRIEEELAKNTEDIKKREETILKAAEKRLHDQAANDARVQGARNKLAADVAEEEMTRLQRQGLEADELKAKYVELAEALRNGSVEGEHAARKVEDANKRLLTQTEKDQKRISDILGRTGYDTINVFEGVYTATRNAFSGIMRGTMSLGQGVKSVFRSMAESILDEFARIAATQVFQWILGGRTLPTAGGGGGGLLGGLLGSFNLSSLFGGGDAGSIPSAAYGTYVSPAYASGTDYVPRTGLALVHQGEKIIPASENKEGSSSITQIIQFSANTPAAVRDAVLSMMPQIQEAAVQAVNSARRRGRGVN